MDAITTETVRVWAKERAKLHEEEADRQRRIADLTRKIDAAAILGLIVEDDPVAQVVESLSAEGDGPSVPDLILAALREAADPLRPPDLKRKMIASGVPASRFGKNGAYFYSSLMRLAKRGLIKKRGKKYSIS